MSAATTRTYRGSSLEELLPRIKEELGPDAIITRRREGVVGGIAGFFGKRCVEVEARAPRPIVPGPALPARAVVGAYQGEGAVEPGELLAAEDALHPSQEPALEGAPRTLMDDIVDEDSRFVLSLAQAIERENRSAAETDPDALRALLLAAGILSYQADEILAEAAWERRTFAPDDPLGAHVRRALAARLRTRREGRRARRRIALVGPPGAGRTLTAAKLCQSYARAGERVMALSLEPARRAMTLASLIEPLDVDLAVADCPAAVEVARARLRGARVLVADTPSAAATDRRSIDDLCRLLAAFQPTECHLVLSRGYPGDEARLLARELRSRARLDGIVVTKDDEELPPTPIGVALSERLPVSYVARGAVAGVGVRPAQPDELARMVVP